MSKKWLSALLLVAVLGVSALAQSAVTLNGAGATFPAPLYAKWATEFKNQTGTEINYRAIGSVGGISAIQGKTVDFGASDAFFADPNNIIIDIPTVAGAVTLTYNLPNVGCVLKFRPSVLAGIFLGTIKQWNDFAIQQDNGSCNLPSANIIVVHRSDGSGTTNAFTSYLAVISPDWKAKVGSGISVNWPTDALGGLAGKGNAGVTQTIQQNPNSIGYVELIYALQNNLPVADLQNPQGEFIRPSLDSTVKALAGLAQIPDDLNLLSLTLNANFAGAYPIVTATYLLVYKDFQNITDPAKEQALVDFFCWGLGSDGQNLGQDFANGLDYANLPQNVRDAAVAKIKSLTFQGQPVNTARFCK